jgi:hypothetical protein
MLVVARVVEPETESGPETVVVAKLTTPDTVAFPDRLNVVPLAFMNVNWDVETVFASTSVLTKVGIVPVLRSVRAVPVPPPKIRFVVDDRVANIVPMVAVFMVAT